MRCFPPTVKGKLDKFARAGQLEPLALWAANTLPVVTASAPYTPHIAGQTQPLSKKTDRVKHRRRFRISKQWILLRLRVGAKVSSRQTRKLLDLEPVRSELCARQWEYAGKMTPASFARPQPAACSTRRMPLSLYSTRPAPAKKQNNCARAITFPHTESRAAQRQKAHALPDSDEPWQREQQRGGLFRTDMMVASHARRRKARCPHAHGPSTL